MLIKTQGIILKQRNIGENDRILILLTRDLGLIEASAKGVKRLKSHLAGATQPLCYSEVCLYKGKNYYSLNSAETLHSFYNLRLDVISLSLAFYFCDIIRFVSPAAEGAWGYLRFLLNTLSLLEQGKKPAALLKSVFELRMMSMMGFMPDLVCCTCCACYESELMYFLPLESKIVCQNCIPRICTENTLKYMLPPATLYAMRHIVYSEEEKLFRFRLMGKSLDQLNFITENYILIHTDGQFKSLDLYKQMLPPFHTCEPEDTENCVEKDQKE